MPPPRSRRKTEQSAPDVTVKVDGVAHELRVNEINALDSSALRRATGLSVQGVLKAAQDDPDLDIIAAIVFLARRQAGEDVTFDDVAAAIDYSSDLDMGEEAEAEEDESGEDLAAN